jgi:hypothetical protein
VVNWKEATMRAIKRDHVSERMQECIDDCNNCHAACLETVEYSLEKGGDHATEAHIRLLLDCAEICQTSANFMLRNSPLHAIICAACAEICERCAVECERFPDDMQMAACARMCRTCAESCKEMAATGTLSEGRGALPAHQ